MPSSSRMPPARSARRRVPRLGPLFGWKPPDLRRWIRKQHRHVDTRDSVHHDVMNLLDENDVTVPIAVDNPELPQWPGPIKGPHHEVCA